MADTTALPKLLTLKQVSELVGVTRQTIWAWVRHGRFPPPVAIGRNRKLWSRAVIERLLAGRDWTRA